MGSNIKGERMFKPTTKTFKSYKWTFKSYFKAAGKGWEVGILAGEQTLFMGNFVHKEEAIHWWNTMNKYASKFFKKYHHDVTPSKEWYFKFFSNHIYSEYYRFLDKVFAKHTRSYHKAFHTGVKSFNKFKDNSAHKHLFHRKAS